jgi:hypothetical protein
MVVAGRLRSVFIASTSVRISFDAKTGYVRANVQKGTRSSACCIFLPVTTAGTTVHPVSRIRCTATAIEVSVGALYQINCFYHTIECPSINSGRIVRVSPRDLYTGQTWG